MFYGVKWYQRTSDSGLDTFFLHGNRARILDAVSADDIASENIPIGS